MEIRNNFYSENNTQNTIIVFKEVTTILILKSVLFH